MTFAFPERRKLIQAGRILGHLRSIFIHNVIFPARSWWRCCLLYLAIIGVSFLSHPPSCTEAVLTTAVSINWNPYLFTEQKSGMNILINSFLNLWTPVSKFYMNLFPGNPISWNIFFWSHRRKAITVLYALSF